MQELLVAWQVFILSLARITTLIMLVPILGGVMVPSSVKVLLSLLLSVACFQLHPYPPVLPLFSLMTFAILLVKEVALGFIISFTLTLLLAAFQMAGEYMGFQMMFASGRTTLPLTRQSSTITGSFVYLVALLLFVGVDGHHQIIQALVYSFTSLPILSLPRDLGPIPLWIHLSGEMFSISLRLSLPVIVVLILTNLVLGIIARTMPQVNVFVIGMPIQLLSGILAMVLILASLSAAELDLFKYWSRELRGLMQVLAR